MTLSEACMDVQDDIEWNKEIVFNELKKNNNIENTIQLIGQILILKYYYDSNELIYLGYVWKV